MKARYVVIPIAVLALAYVVAWVVYSSHADSRCLAHGYTAHRVTWDFTGYCTMRHIPDVVVPLDDLPDWDR
jgi:hypothetical protein